MNKNVLCENIKKTYYNNCNDFVLSEIAEIELKFVALFIGVTGIVYLKNNKELLSELLFRIGYGSFLAATKVSNAFRRIKNCFVFSQPTATFDKKKTYVYDEVKVIKNGVRHASFETMATFNESSYLGNPNHDESKYEQFSLINRAHKLTRPLLLIHGLADDNVLAMHTLKFSAKLLAEGKMHQFIPLSGVSHMTPQEVITENLLRMQLDFFKTNLVR